MSEAKPRLWVSIIIHVLLLVWLLMSIMPFLWTLATSFKEVVDAFAVPPKFIFTPTTEAYELLWGRERFPEYLLNSAIVAASTVTISITIGCLAGYGLARYSGMSGFVILIAALLFRSLPRMAFALPYFIVGQWVGLYDTKLLLVLVLGCWETPVVNDHEHERKVLELANRHAEQQSLQSRQMADLQKQWQSERTDLNEQRDRFESSVGNSPSIARVSHSSLVAHN